MEDFKVLLQQEFVRRAEKNPSYSLRAYAKQLGVNHATLSTLLSGKRKITKSTVSKFAKVLKLSPKQVAGYSAEGQLNRSGPNQSSYFVIQEDAFNTMSDWHYDAILELSLIPKVQLEPDVISQLLGISLIKARLALETLVRLELLSKIKSGSYKLCQKDTTNILDHDFTTTAQKKYQKSVLEKSVEALESTDRKYRDHTSTTMAIDIKDIPKVKQLIKKFRNDLNSYLQRDETAVNEVYQLQVSFFPLSRINENEEKL